MKYILILLLLVGCSNPVGTHPNDNAEEYGCENCHTMIYIIDWGGAMKPTYLRMNKTIKTILIVMGFLLFVPLLLIYLDIMSEFLNYLFETEWIKEWIWNT